MAKDDKKDKDKGSEGKSGGSKKKLIIIIAGVVADPDNFITGQPTGQHPKARQRDQRRRHFPESRSPLKNSQQKDRYKSHKQTGNKTGI